MALVHCKECKKEISDSAKSCPHCGFKPGFNIGCGGLIVLLFVAYAVFSPSHNKNYESNASSAIDAIKKPETTFDKNYSAAGACMIFIKKQLHDPDSAEFDMTADAYVAEEKGYFIVQRHIRAKNGFGAKVKKVMECKLLYKDKNWYPIYVKEIR